MAANVIYATAEQWAALSEILEALDEGGVIVPPETAALLLEGGATKEELEGLTFLDQYDYGGDPDVWLDIAKPGSFAHHELKDVLAAAASEARR